MWPFLLLHRDGTQELYNPHARPHSRAAKELSVDRVHKTIAGTRHTITRQQVLAELVRYGRDYPGND